MGKASSSRKKERSKTSSSQRSRRKSKSSRRLKSKKLRYRHDSPSCSDTDFESSTSVSSSSSEDDKKVRRSRSKTRKNSKPSKKRSKKQSHDHQSRECSPHPRKRKHSKRSDRYEAKKTNKKKRRRDASVGATNSDSLGRSTCGDGSSTSSDSEIDRRRGRSGKRKRNMVKTEGRRYRSKSRSPCSLCSDGSDFQNEVEDDSYVENSCRRLKSIIVVVGEEDELKTFVGNEQQEAVTHQLDDNHPSFGDMNSKDGTSKRELDYVISKEAPEVESKNKIVTPDNRNSLILNDDGVRNEGSNKNHGGVTNDHSLDERKNGCSGNTESINCIDLESILRQKALENLRKFKGVSPRNVEIIANCKVENNNDAKQLISPVSKSVHVTFPRDDAEINVKGFSRQDGGDAVNSMIVKGNGFKSTDAIDTAVASMHDPVCSSQNLGKISNGSNAFRPESKVDSFIKKASVDQECIQTKSSISDIVVDETAQTQTQMTNNDDQNIRNGFGSSAYKSSSSLNPISGENRLDKSRQESGEGSQFEQKTMSVMRGGEMVQVNYKVYIPKRAPALTRRQLKR
ncbi:probable replication factor C subunit 1 isoform X2 [Cucurbita moschata]|uniref:Probable replication factor C subunit 1 isoform X2 n=1 Tax=Cucurbita moschata TaxID=3662 RepID=A0A6J1FBA2_CUCMO|nr:probable replication factor C subunit 1 isoform X2 [Cucurbita moschata]